MLRAQNDIIRALGDNKVVMLVLIDLSAAFDTVNHERSQQLECGLPQGSVLGPILFNIYTAAFGLLLRQEKTNYSMYTDDTDLYLIFKPSELTENVAEMERTAGLVRWWQGSKLGWSCGPSLAKLLSDHQMVLGGGPVVYWKTHHK